LFSETAALQFQIIAGDISANLNSVKRLIQQLRPGKNTILVLPELWAYGFEYLEADKLARQTPDILQSLQELAAQREVFFAGSLLEKYEGADKPFNTLFVSGPNGVVGAYRKQHLFSFWGEDAYFAPGKWFKPIDTPFGPLGSLVCYDLRYPRLATSQAFHGAELIVVSAQWPAARQDHWRILLQARAIENQVFIAAANSCGLTGKYELAGHSMIIAPDGRILVEADQQEGAISSKLEYKDLQELRSRFCSVGERPTSLDNKYKIKMLDDLKPRLANIRKQGSKIAFTNGCFDILHSGHVDYLEQARSTADCLVVGLNSDASVKLLEKGESRPINSETDRARVLSGLACVDYVVLFDEDTPYNLITSLMPDVLLKGADWEEDRIVGAREVKAGGGKIVRVSFKYNVSTTQLIAKIKKS